MSFKLRLLFAVFIVSISISYASEVKFYNINTLFGISMRETNSVCKDSNGFIWISSKTGILRLTEDDYRTYPIPYITANVLTVKLVYKDSLLLAYTNNGQIFKYNEVGDRFELIVNLPNELRNIFLGVNSVIIEDANTYWIATSMGLFKLRDNNLVLVGNDNSLINYAIGFKENQLIFSKVDEISLLDTKTMQVINIYKNQTATPLNVSKLFYDNVLDRLWVGTLSNGLFYYDFNAEMLSELTIKSFPKQPILAMESISETSLLIGIDGQGVWEINKKGDRVLNIYKENSDNLSSLRGNGVYDIYCEPGKRVWVCTYSGGASYYEQTSPLLKHLTHQVNNANSLVNNDVNSLIEDSRGNLWFATNNGISCWEIGTNQWRSFYVNKQEQAQVFLTLCEDDKGRIWAGTYSSGVYVLDGRTGKELAHYSDQEKG